MSKLPKSAFVISKNDAGNDELFIRCDFSGINNMVILIDNIPMVTFKRLKHAYLNVDDIIGWYEKEIPRCKADGKGLDYCEEMLELYKTLRVKYTATPIPQQVTAQMPPPDEP